MKSSIHTAEANVQKAFDRARSIAESGSATLASTEAALWTALLALGRDLLALFLARRATARRSESYEFGDRRYSLNAKWSRTTQLGTRFGKVEFTRPIGRPPGTHGRGRADLPVDRELGISSGFSLGTMTVLVQLCTMMAFATARDTFKRFHGWTPSSRSTLRIIDAVGQHARTFLNENAVPESDGEVLVIEVDGRGAPMITHTERARRKRPKGKRGEAGTKRHRTRQRRKQNPRPRRKPGDKSKNAKVAFVGVIYTLRRTEHGLEGPINKRLIATFDSHEALFRWLHEHAVARGYGTKKTYFLADGADAIWRRQQLYFPLAEVCIDWIHVVEKLWDAAACIHPAGGAALAEWIAEQKRRLRIGKPGAVVAELSRAYAAIPKTGPGNKGRRRRLLAILEYVAGHQHRMRYATLRREDMDIGTGAVEGAVRNLVAMRLDAPGMRWGRERSEVLLQLRCILLNRQWDAFAEYLLNQDTSLKPDQIPATPHDPAAPPSSKARLDAGDLQVAA